MYEYHCTLCLKDKFFFICLKKMTTEDQRFAQSVFEDHLDFIEKALDKDQNVIQRRIQELRQMEDLVEFMVATLELKKELLGMMLEGDLKLKLPPTFINHMINEAEMLIRIVNGEKIHILEIHKLWLLDAEGHLVTIMKKLDPVEKILKKQLKKEKCRFHDLFCKTLEFIGYLRSGIDHFAALQRLTSEAVAETVLYLDLIVTFYDDYKDNSVLSVMDAKMIEHMIREQRYYLSQIEEK